MPILIILVNVELAPLNIDLCAVYGHGNIGVINCFSQDTMSACRCNWAINVVDRGPRDTAAGRQDTGLPNTPGSQSNSTVVPSPLMGNATPAIFRSSFQALRSAWRVNRGHRKSSKHHLQMVQAWICGNTTQMSQASPLESEVTLDGKPHWMQVDTGAAAAVSLMSQRTSQNLLPGETLQATHPNAHLLRTRPELHGLIDAPTVYHLHERLAPVGSRWARISAADRCLRMRLQLLMLACLHECTYIHI